MKKLLLLILPVLLLLTTVNTNVKADSDNDGWYIPDLEEYTFNIPNDWEEFMFIRHEFDTGNFVDFVTREYDFGVSQNANGALDFSNIYRTLSWVGSNSLLGRYGLTPMIFLDTLPSYISYTIYNVSYLLDYNGAVDIHCIIYRLDFFGNYSMLLDGLIYDIVDSIEIIYELVIYYYDEIDGIQIGRGYTVDYYDTSEMKKRSKYTSMKSNFLQFQLRDIVNIEDYEQGYDDGYNAGYDVGYETGQDEGYDEGYNIGYNEGYDIGFEIAQPKMDILLITLIMFIVSVFVYFKFRLKWVLIATILLWFVPIFLVENLFIKIFSVIMIIVTIVITFFSDREEDDYE